MLEIETDKTKYFYSEDNQVRITAKLYNTTSDKF